MARLYEPAAYDTAQWPDSYWRATSQKLPPLPPLTGDAETEVAIIGAGYAGLNAALELAESHGIRATVLDAGQPGWGASGRNAGFACMGGTSLEGSQIARMLGAEAAAEWKTFERAAIERVRDNLARYAIAHHPGPEGEVCLAHSPRRFRAMCEAPPEPDTALWDRDELAARGLAGPGFHGGLSRAQGFGLQPLDYVLGLARAAQAAGVTIQGDSAVCALKRDGAAWVLQTATGRLRARRVLVATNGYSDEALPEWLGGRIFPVLSAILVTRALTPDERAAQGWTSQLMAYDSRRVLHYFRLLPCGRFLFGGRGGTSADPAALAAFHTTLRAEFEAMFPAFAGAQTQHYWAGFVCLTGSLAPYCAEVPDQTGLFAALGWHGNGVAAASAAGRAIAAPLAGLANPVPRLMQQPPRRFWPAGLRRPMLTLGIGLAKALDRWR